MHLWLPEVRHLSAAALRVPVAPGPVENGQHPPLGLKCNHYNHGSRMAIRSIQDTPNLMESACAQDRVVACGQLLPTAHIAGCADAGRACNPLTRPHIGTVLGNTLR